MIARLTSKAPFFLGGALLFSLVATFQAIVFDGRLALALYLLTVTLGGFGGLWLAIRNSRIEQLRQSIRRLETLYAESEQRYRCLFERNQTAQLLINPETGDIVEANEAASRFYGYSPDELHGMTIADLNTNAPDTLRIHLQRALAQEQLCFRFQHRLRSGELRAVAVHTVPVPLHGQPLLHSLVFDVTEQSQAESKLRRKIEEQRLLVDSIPVGIWYLRDPETLGSVNKAFAGFFGLPPKEVAHRRLESLYTKEMLAPALAGNQRVFAQKTTFHGEQWLTTDKGEPRAMAITKTPKLDANGEVEFVVCTATDITDVQQARELLRIERDLLIALRQPLSLEQTLRVGLEKAIEFSQCECGGLYLVDPGDGSLTLAVHHGLADDFVATVTRCHGDSGHARLVRHGRPVYTSHQALDMPVENDRVREEGLKAMAIIPIAFQGRVIACLNVASRRLDQVPRFSRMALERVAADLGTVLARQEQEALIHQQRQNLETLFNTIEDLVFVLDPDGTVIHLNPAAATRLAFRVDELVGQNIEILHPPGEEGHVRTLVAAVLGGTGAHGTLPLLTRHGEAIPVETRFSLGQWDNRQVIFALSRDISDRLQVERQQRLLLKNEGLERMAGAMAHHFNNLMTIVAGNLELAREDVGQGAQIDGLLDNALQGVRRATHLGQALLVYTGNVSEAPVPIDLAEFCRQQLESGKIAAPGHIAVTVELAAPGPVVMAYPTHLEQALLALITNAAESIGPAAGRIVVRVGPLASGTPAPAHLFPAGWTPQSDTRYGCLEISDTGGGIEETRMVSIFDPFYSEKFLGRGLGLALALSIVKKLDGAIAVTSRRGQGSTFQVLLPQVAPSGGR